MKILFAVILFAIIQYIDLAMKLVKMGVFA